MPPGATASSEDDTGPTEIVIRAQTGWIPIDWKELYAFRELLFFFVWRDISARYKQTVLGSAWADDPALAHDGDLHASSPGSRGSILPRSTVPRSPTRCSSSPG